MATGLMIMLCITGCMRRSALEGKVVDGKGQPIGGIKMIATPIQPTRDVQIETITGEDGSFKLGKILPNSRYDLVADTDKYLTEFGRRKIDSGPAGQTTLLPAVELRFDTQKEDVVIDTKTGLIWPRNANIAINPMDWTEAMNWAERLNYAGYDKGWRLPTKEELMAFLGIMDRKTLAAKFSNMQMYISYWTSTTADFNKDYAWCVLMLNGGGAGHNIKAFKYYVWPVRDQVNTVLNLQR